MRKNVHGKFIYLFIGVIGVLVVVFQLKTILYASELDSTVITSSQAEFMSDSEIIDALVSEDENIPDAEIIEGDYIDSDGIYYANETPSVVVYDDSALIDILNDILLQISELVDISRSTQNTLDVLVYGNSSILLPHYEYNYLVTLEEGFSFVISSSSEIVFDSDDEISIFGSFYTYLKDVDDWFSVDISDFFDVTTSSDTTIIHLGQNIFDLDIDDFKNLTRDDSGILSSLSVLGFISQCLIIFIFLFSFVEIYRTSKMIRKKFIGGEN